MNEHNNIKMVGSGNNSNSTEIINLSMNEDNLIIIFSVPFPPVDFNITSEYFYTSNVVVTLEWEQLLSEGLADFVHNYTIFTQSGHILTVAKSSPWNVTLDYNKEYTIFITAENCIGSSPSTSISTYYYYCK